MRLIKMFDIAALAAMAGMAFVGATTASASATRLCLEHGFGGVVQLLCQDGEAQTHVHMVLKAGTVLKLLSPISVLCLGELTSIEPLGLAAPQVLHFTAKTSTGCGTSSAHNNCSLTVEELPLGHLLKAGLDLGIGLKLSGRMRLVCKNLGIDCVYDLEGTEFSAGGGDWTMEETPTTELGGKFFCPDEGFFDGLLESLLPTYILS